MASHDSPKQVLDHGSILILPTTVVGVQVYCLLAQPMVYEEMMEHTYDYVGALPHVDSLIDQVVHLSREGFTTHTKDGTLPGSQKVHGAELEGVIGVKLLLCLVKTVVGMDGSVGVLMDDRCAAGGGGENTLSSVK